MAGPAGALTRRPGNATNRDAAVAGWFPPMAAALPFAPDADPSDDLLDVCYNVKILTAHGCSRFSTLRGLAVTGSSCCVNLLKFTQLQPWDFRHNLPCQVDGEELCGTHFG